MRIGARRLHAVPLSLLLLCLGVHCGSGELWAQERSFLWKVESGRNTIYLLGSIHLLNKESAPLGAAIDFAFDQSKRLVFEIDIANEGAEKTQQLIRQIGMNLDGTTLEQKVSTETYELAALRAKELGIDIRMMNPFKPWMVGLTMLAMQLQRLGYDPNLGVDRQLARRAKQANKPVTGLETSEFQIRLFDQLPPKLQELMLRQSLAEMAHLGKMVDAMVRAWQSGDAVGVEKYFHDSMKGFPELQEKLIDERNRNWLPQIERLFTLGEPSLVVVGAAHLVGKNGVIELLKGRGYKMEQL